MVLDAAVVLAAYEVYRYVRAFIHGSTRQADIHARQIVAAERRIGLFHERAVQAPFDSHKLFMQFWNVWYGAAHFAGPILGLAILYLAAPDRYRRWRNILGWVCALALIGFALYALAPPRLLPSRFGFVDTAVRYGGIGPVGKDENVGAFNAYAAMPSLHLAWSTWTACALWPLVRGRRRVLLLLIPASMLFAVVVTANHYFLDAVGGWVTLALAIGAENLRGRAMGGGGTVPVGEPSAAREPGGAARPLVHRSSV